MISDSGKEITLFRKKQKKFKYFVFYHYEREDGITGAGNIETTTSFEIKSINDVKALEKSYIEFNKFKNVVVSHWIHLK